MLSREDEKKTPFIVAHEFFDALPIHVFELVDIPPNRSSDPRTSPDGNASSGSAQDPSPAEGQPTDEGPDHSAPSTKTARSTLQWREMLVTPSPPDATHASLGTPPSLQRAAGGVVPDFQLSRARNHTRHSRYLPDSSARYRAIKAAASRLSPTDPVSRGGASAVIEVSPDASLYASDFATRIGGSPKHPKHRASGAALIIDYGPGDGTVPRNTLRGIRRHELVSPFVLPGAVDLSADVDFAAIAESALRASEGVEVHGPVEQGVWLEGMGIRERAKALMEGSKRGSSGNDVKEKVERALSRLVDRGVGGMGRLYKVLAILPENEGRRRPVGFGGDVDV